MAKWVPIKLPEPVLDRLRDEAADWEGKTGGSVPLHRVITTYMDHAKGLKAWMLYRHQEMRRTSAK